MKPLLTLAVVLASIVAHAAPLAPLPLPEAPAKEREPSFTFSAGYMSKYLFYGMELGRSTPWSSLKYDFQDLPMPLGVEVWYARPSSGIVNHELDLILRTGTEIAGFDAELSFAGYLYPSSGGLKDSYEVKLGLGREIGPVDWNAAAAYDFVIRGWFFETGLGKEVALTDSIGLTVGSGVGYQAGYNAPGNDWNHAYATASLPITLHENVVLEPYIGWLSALRAIETIQDDTLHGGVTLKVAF